MAVRLTAELIDELDWQANSEGLLMASGEPNRSDLIRLMIQYAREHMPPGWRPVDDADVDIGANGATTQA